MAKTIYGIDQVGRKTPQWAKNTYRIAMLLTTAIAAWVAATGIIPMNVKTEIILALKCIDPVTYGLAQLTGVSEDPPADVNKP